MRRNAIAVIAAALLFAAPFLLGQRPPYDLPDPKPQDRIIASFTAEVESRTNRQVRFRWAIQEDDRDDHIACTLDKDSDDLVESSIDDCVQTEDLLVSYEQSGTFRAVLVARNRAGGSDLATTTVTID